ncbi:MAG: 3D domain-containing protein [Terrisporobacter sp.]|uniref:3D domain-containing protein n=1 Tax=Terrisporobacter sp. TaxID=1965305 RepID=UPI002FC6B077
MNYINRKIKTILLSGLLSMGIVSTGYIAFNKEIVLVVDGQEREVSSFKTDVKGVLEENNINYDSNDKISEDLDASLENGMTIEVKQVEKKEIKDTTSVDYKTIVKKDSSLEEGKSKIAQEGKKGTKELIYEAIYHNGYLARKTLVKENITEKPQNEIIVKGTKKKETKNSKATSSRIISKTTKSNSLRTKVMVSATAYSGDSITATGTVPKWGTIAVDPSVIPYGTKVYIPQFNQYFIAEDCGGGIKGNKIDIFMNSESQCNSWGKRTIEIYIVK